MGKPGHPTASRTLQFLLLLRSRQLGTSEMAAWLLLTLLLYQGKHWRRLALPWALHSEPPGTGTAESGNCPGSARPSS